MKQFIIMLISLISIVNGQDTTRTLITRSGQTLRETAFAAGQKNDTVTGRTINGKNYVPNNVTSKFRTTQELYVTANNVDRTVVFNRMISHSQIRGLIVSQDSVGSNLRVTGTVNGGGKMLRFDGSVVIKGANTGVLNNVIIDAPGNIQIFDSIGLANARTTNGVWYPEWFGAKGDSTTDDTNAFNRMMSVINNQPQPNISLTGKYKINGAVTFAYPNRVNVKFERGAMITGNGTFGGGGVVNAPYDQQIWGDSLNVSYYTTDNVNHSVKWFGAKGNGITDDHFAIQKAINFNKTYFYEGKSIIYFPIGTYIITKPLLVFNWNGSIYTQVTISLMGERSTQKGVSSRALIKASGEAMGRQFLLGIQIGKQCLVENIAFEGLYTRSVSLAQSNYRNIVNSVESDWEQSGISSKTFAPHAAIVFDPFSASPPADTGYVDLQSYYRGNPGPGSVGSGQNTFEGCMFSYVYAGVVVGLATNIGQSEYLKFLHCSWTMLKVGYVTANSQSNNCIIYDFEAVGWIHHFIDNISFGSTAGGSPPFIDKGVVAQGMLMFACVSSQTKPLYVKHVFFESLYKIGVFNGLDAGYQSVGAFEQCTFNLMRYDELKSADWIVLGKVNFTDCNTVLISGATTRPFRLKLAVKKSDAVFKGGVISQVLTKFPPLRSPTLSSYQKIPLPTFNDVVFYRPANNVRFSGQVQNTYPLAFMHYSPVGTNKLKWTEIEGIKYEFEWNEPLMDETIYLTNGRSITIDSTGAGSIILDSTSRKKINISDILTTDFNAGLEFSQIPASLLPGNANTRRDEMPVLGLVTAIRGDTIDIVGASRNLPNGTTTGLNVYLNFTRMNSYLIAFDATNGSNVLTNVELYVPMSTGEFGFPPAGTRLEHPSIPPGARVIASSSGDKTITLSIPATATVTDATSIIGQPKVSAESIYSPAQAAALSPSPAFFINGMTWKWRTKDGSNAEQYYEYRIGNTAFKNQYYTAATRVLNTLKVTQISPSVPVSGDGLSKIPVIDL